jgi:hypothetical protein
MLSAGGYLLLRIHDFSKHRRYIDVIRGLDAHVEHAGAVLLIRPPQRATIGSH